MVPYDQIDACLAAVYGKGYRVVPDIYIRVDHIYQLFVCSFVLHLGFDEKGPTKEIYYV